MKTITKALVGTVAAGAMAVGSISPAQAQSRSDRRDRDRGGIDAGDVIAGALIIGGIAAIASAAGRNRDRGYDGGNWGRYGDPRQAVEQCVSSAERGANRYSYGGRSDVTDIRSITRRGDGYVVKGRIAVNQQGRNWRQGDNRYGRGWNNDYRGWNDRYQGYDAGNFTCRIERGRVTDLDYSGIRGL